MAYSKAKLKSSGDRASPNRNIYQKQKENVSRELIAAGA
jgi:hypothetical protein